jgi:hypothetical protein
VINVDSPEIKMSDAMIGEAVFNRTIEFDIQRVSIVEVVPTAPAAIPRAEPDDELLTIVESESVRLPILEFTVSPPYPVPIPGPFVEMLARILHLQMVRFKTAEVPPECLPVPMPAP